MSSRAPGSRLLSALVLLAMTLGWGAPLWADKKSEEYEKALKMYRRNLDRPSLHKRSVGRLRLARTKDPRALDILVGDYAGAEAPRDMVRYWLAFTLTREFGDKQDHLHVFKAWRQQNTKPTDGWLWYRTLLRETELNGPKTALAVVRGKHNVYVRVAAIEALVTAGADECLELIPELLAKLPSDAVKRALILEALGSCLLSQRWRLKEPEFEAPSNQLIRMMDDPKTLPRTKHVLARYFGTLLETEDRFVAAQPWLNAFLFARKGEEGTDEGYGRKRERLVFGGIEATGDRIAYVIDLSDSMLKELSPDVLTLLRKLPTGPVTGGPAAPPTVKKRKVFADQNLINWKKVRTRFDAAREMLKLSLISLPVDKEFVVIVFGDEGRLLKTCKGLKQAKPAYVSKVIKELNGIRRGPPSAERPDGGLRGKTNLHGGMLRAFQVVKRGLRGQGAYVDTKAYLNGVETIFLLSDGRPTWDDWGQADTRDKHDRVGDPELGEAPQQESPNMNFPSPYGGAERVIREDIARLNLYRKCEIHCVGLGEASKGYLSFLADTGLGKVKMVGKEDD